MGLSFRGTGGYILPILRDRPPDVPPPSGGRGRRDRSVAGAAGRPAPARRRAPPGRWEDRTVPSVEERVIEIVCENLGVNKEQVNRNTSFIEDVGADSLDIVELIMELEEEFEINIPDEQAEKIKTVGEAIDYIEKEIAKK
jgi:acyl carrier protein